MSTAEAVPSGWKVPERVAVSVTDLDLALDAYGNGCGPAYEGDIRVMLGRLANHFVMPNRTAEMYGALFEDYIEALQAYSPGAIEEARVEAVRTLNFFPRLAELLPLVRAAQVRQETLWRRAWFAKWVVEECGGVFPKVRRLHGGSDPDGIPDFLLEKIVGVADCLERTEDDFDLDAGERRVGYAWAVRFPARHEKETRN